MKQLYRVVTFKSTILILADSVDEATALRGDLVRSVKVLTPKDMPQYSAVSHAELRSGPISGYVSCRQTGKRTYQWFVASKTGNWSGQEYNHIV